MCWSGLGLPETWDLSGGEEGGGDQVQGEEAKISDWSGPDTDNERNWRGGWSDVECPII